MKFLILLFISIPSLGSTPSAEQISHAIYEKSADQNRFPSELNSVPSLRWACQIEQENQVSPKSCLKLLQILEDLSGESQINPRERLLARSKADQKKLEIENYKRRRAASGTSGE